jgi:glycosyltransferase involved in cell wall biosynthesis
MQGGQSLLVIANFHNMRREARRTLHSLSAQYQKGVDPAQYQVIAIDNGSSEPLSEEFVRGFGTNFHYRSFDTKSVSPVGAINQVIRETSSDYIMLIVDGAHILSPGILGLSLKALRVHERPMVATVPFHLGAKHQTYSILEGYNQATEDEMLDGSGWESDGYRLFQLAGNYADGSNGWFGCLYESNCFATSREVFQAAGGLNEDFQTRGGGLVNLDIFQNIMALPNVDYVMLLSEGTFHQVHGGVASNAPWNQQPWQEFNEEFKRIRGRDFRLVPRQPVMFGTVRPEALHIALVSASAGLKWWQELLNQRAQTG